MKNYKELVSYLTEARSDNPKVEYKELDKRGGTVINKCVTQVAKVVAVVTGNALEGTLKDSKLSVKSFAQKFMRVENKLKELKTAQDELKTKVLADIVPMYFDATDELCTRIIEVGKVVIQVSKTPEVKDSEKFNHEGFFTELNNMGLAQELLDQLTELKKKFTEVKKAGPRKPTVDVELKEAFSIKPLLNWFSKVFKKWTEKFDKKFDKLKSKYNLK